MCAVCTPQLEQVVVIAVQLLWLWSDENESKLKNSLFHLFPVLQAGGAKCWTLTLKRHLSQMVRSSYVVTGLHRAESLPRQGDVCMHVNPTVVLSCVVCCQRAGFTDQFRIESARISKRNLLSYRGTMFVQRFLMPYSATRSSLWFQSFFEVVYIG